MTIKEYLSEYKLLTDGAMGTYFDTVYHGECLCSEEANITHPDYICEIHKQYIENGARLLRTNTFSCNRQTLKQLKKENPVCFAGMELKEWIQAGYDLTMRAAEESDVSHIFVAADIGPVSEDGDSKTSDILQEYYEICDAFLEKEAPIYILETFPDDTYVLKMADYIRKGNPDAFIIGQFSFSPTGYGSTGRYYKTVLSHASESGLLDGVGINCGVGAVHMEKFLHSIFSEQIVKEEMVFSVLPNCGYPRIVRGRAVYADSASYFGQKAASLCDIGANIIGGCCGTTPLCIGEIQKRLDGERKQAGHHPNRPAPVKKYVQELPQDKNTQELPQKESPGNQFKNKLLSGQAVLAVELDPPFDSDAKKIIDGAGILSGTKADIITVADSPMARSRADSVLMAARLRELHSVDVMPHIACRDRNRIAIRSLLLGAYIHEIRNLLVVTGDPVAAAERSYTKSVFDYNSIKLMKFISEMNKEVFSQDPLFYGGALNQNGENPDGIARRMEMKMEQGCSYFLTQPVYSLEGMERIAYLKEKTGAKILIGIMPLVSHKNALFIQNEMPGIHVPDEVIEQYPKEGTRESWEETALYLSLSMIKEGKDIGAGFYFMTPFNRVTLIKKILDQVKIDEQGKII